MNFDHYMSQVRRLRAYARVPQIPKDPYDIPIGLAKRLLRYDSTIKLDARHRLAYGEAVKASHEHGPCCCHCWRWSTFEGQAKYLLTQVGYTPRRIARVWNLEDGCGGPVDQSNTS